MLVDVKCGRGTTILTHEINCEAVAAGAWVLPHVRRFHCVSCDTNGETFFRVFKVSIVDRNVVMGQVLTFAVGTKDGSGSNGGHEVVDSKKLSPPL